MKFYLDAIKSIEDLKTLFIEQWNWEVPEIPGAFFEFPEEIKNKIRETRIIAKKLDYKIIFFELENIENSEKRLRSIEKQIVNTQDIRNLLEKVICIFSLDNLNYLDFVKPEKIRNRIRIKRFSISPENRGKLRTPSEQLKELKIDSQKLSPSYLKNRLDEAFSVEAVTGRFFEEYIEIFSKIRESLIKQKVEVPESKKSEYLRDFIHQTLNRLMFLYFVQKRGCFGNKNFLANFWDSYKNKFKGEDKFHREWLEVLFFEALSQPSFLYQGQDYLRNFNKSLREAPYLNGGLFERQDFDKIEWKIPDELFDDIFEFFESYNFTVEESTPFEIEIAINPEMLGNIYEHLVNVEEKEEQSRAGIFYTPKIEIELMIRRSLVEFLCNQTKINKEKLYQFVFPELEERIEDAFTKKEAEKVLKELNEIFILDPACGSGHYLVVAAQILYKLKTILWKKLKIKHLGPYEEKKKIIEHNIYGNDIEKWAVDIAKLRLWLDLFVDAEKEIIEEQATPLLPNLGFKIRSGDSLVQKLGDNLIPLRKIGSLLTSRRVDLKALIQKKEFVYERGDGAEYNKTLWMERKLLQNILSDYEIKLNQQLQYLNVEAKKAQGKLFEKEKKSEQAPLFKKEIEKTKSTLEEIKRFKEELRQLEEPPMIWDISFAEVFVRKNGFDVVIANPPYVRQERIEDLTGFCLKKEYKEKLIEQTNKDWSYNFKGQPVKSPIPARFDKRCDLYIYFYFKGLKLLNENGILCYISSNSWLDVGFGRILQEVLLRRVPILAIYDNQAKRSFKHADVNTIIAVLGAPKMKDFDEGVKNNEADFVMFKKPFEEIMFSDIFIELEKTDKDSREYPEGKRKESELYRIHRVNQKDLYEYGRDKETGEYTGNKWGGKYLRAPEIYWIILEKGKDKLVRLGDIAEVRRGFTTGANEFFYVEDVTDKIED